MSLSLLLLPRRGLLLAAAAVGRRSLSQARPRRSGDRTRPHAKSRLTGTAGAATLVGSLSLSVFSMFSRKAEKEKQGEEGQNEETEEDTIIFLLKKAKLSIMKGELEEAERLLHEAAGLSHQSDNKKAIIYTYDTMANLAFLRGQLDHAEKLFKAAMSYLLAGDMKQDDNAIIEMSLKLASIYAAQEQHKLALAGYEFCILTLEEKIAKQKDMPADGLPEEEKVDTLLLLGMTLDSYARFLLAHDQAAVAQRMYKRALQISLDVQGETHPQKIIHRPEKSIKKPWRGQRRQKTSLLPNTFGKNWPNSRGGRRKKSSRNLRPILQESRSEGRSEREAEMLRGVASASTLQDPCCGKHRQTREASLTKRSC
ncbi:tetratricopeptide repeat protein 19, mitochondrial isoform X3 [Rhineura floridana]|uniref:tetratricopeptide repeat protein 19, mitochondrial isoform X3 n=1 Tax=Rhineura floridana TaxID=261503 RepID=UPI002AC82EE7|nr:tetratricopeptide repeat protein 19, mitochondrial isoform X3 [Rhineura floridana]